MALLDDVLAANAAAVGGSDVPVPALAEGRRVVIVTCSEIRSTRGRDLATYFGLDRDETLVVANAGGRVRSPDGDVVRSVVVGLAQGEGGEVFVVAHEDCAFLESDPESVTALFGRTDSSRLQAVEALCGPSFVSARNLTIAAAETLRRSPFLPPRTPVHALVFDARLGRLSAEQSGYGATGDSSWSFGAPGAAPSGMGSPSPILGAPGPTGFGAAGPVSLFGTGPSSLMGTAPPPLVAPAPDMGAGTSFLAPPPPEARPADTSAFPAPMTSTVVPSTKAEPWAFKDVPPPPPPRASPPAPPPLPPPAQRPAGKPAGKTDADDAFRRAQETLERLRRERRR